MDVQAPLVSTLLAAIGGWNEHPVGALAKVGREATFPKERKAQENNQSACGDGSLFFLPRPGINIYASTSQKEGAIEKEACVVCRWNGEHSTPGNVRGCGMLQSQAIQHVFKWFPIPARGLSLSWSPRSSRRFPAPPPFAS